MLVAGFPADAFGTNCYVVAAAPGEHCLIVDPGIGVLDRLDALLAEHRLRPAAVLLTHGHIDHTFSVAPVCGARGITAYVHPGDREMLADPSKALSTDLAALFGGRLPYSEPEDVAELTDGATLFLAGLEITVDHAPGHTGGSVLFRLPGRGARGLGVAGPPVPGARRPPNEPVSLETEQVCLSGDVLFAGSIGRTDLPGGSMPAMMSSLREKVLPLADDTVVLPGHGPATTIGRERAGNPYLRKVAGGDPRRGAPARGL